jgi:hypothetical protein
MIITALPAGSGMYRIPAFILQGVPVPMVTIMLFRAGWVANLDGSFVKHDVLGSTVAECARQRIVNHLADNGVRVRELHINQGSAHRS